MSTVEVEYDTNERDSWLALREYEDAVCPQCGYLKVICADPLGLHGDGFYPQREVCWVSAVGKSVGRRFDRLHKDADPDMNGFLPGDGVRFWMALDDLTPEDDFLNEGPAPLPS